MARKRRKGASPVGKLTVIIVLALVIVAALGTIGFLYFAARQNYVPLEKASLCPTAGVVSQTIVLLDTTDPLADITKSELMSRLSDVSSGVIKGGLLQVWVLNEDPAETRPILSLCNPGNGTDIDPMIGNAALAHERWAQRFVGPVEAALKRSIGGNAQHFSPILAGIQKIAAERLSTTALQQVPTSLVVVSDLLENTPYYSHFKDGVNFPVYEAKVGARYLTQLHAATVNFWMVQRPRADIDATALATFWLEWVEASGGRGQVDRLMGM